MEQTLTLADRRLLDLVWRSQPVASPQLCKLAQAELGWKRTTTYTVLKRLCDKGCLQNQAAVVTALVTREEVQQADGRDVLQRSFGGSLPSFLAAFLRSGSVSDQDAAQIQQMLADYQAAHADP
jgi:predicted transcriptional regulator